MNSGRRGNVSETNTTHVDFLEGIKHTHFEPHTLVDSPETAVPAQFTHDDAAVFSFDSTGASAFDSDESEEKKERKGYSFKYNVQYKTYNIKHTISPPPT